MGLAQPRRHLEVGVRVCFVEFWPLPCSHSAFTFNKTEAWAWELVLNVHSCGCSSILF